MMHGFLQRRRTLQLTRLKSGATLRAVVPETDQKGTWCAGLARVKPRLPPQL
jgi:hypothetical protein